MKVEFLGEKVVAREIKFVPIISVASGGPAMTVMNFLYSRNCSQKMQIVSFSVLSANYGGMEVEF